jgi:hypothetical protein
MMPELLYGTSHGFPDASKSFVHLHKLISTCFTRSAERLKHLPEANLHEVLEQSVVNQPPAFSVQTFNAME